MQMPRLASHAPPILPLPLLKKPPLERDVPAGADAASFEDAPAVEPAEKRTKRRARKGRGVWDKLKRHSSFIGPGIIASVAYVSSLRSLALLDRS